MSIDLAQLASPSRRNDYRRWYFKERLPIERRSWTACLDILGYKRTVLDSIHSSETPELVRLFEAVKEARPHLSFDTFPWFLKTYSDNVLLASPLVDDGEMGWFYMIGAVAGFQAAMALRGYFIRGALACGNLHVSNNLVYGSALIEAHEAEQSWADWPRTVLTISSMAIVADHLSYSGGNPASTPHYYEVLKDPRSGLWFLDHLRIGLVDERNRPRESLRCHRDIVQSAITRFPQGRISQKYRRLAAYHNLICEELGWRDLRIRAGRLPTGPQRLTHRDWNSLYTIIRRERRKNGLAETPFDQVRT